MRKMIKVNEKVSYNVYNDSYEKEIVEVYPKLQNSVEKAEEFYKLFIEIIT